MGICLMVVALALAAGPALAQGVQEPAPPPVAPAGSATATPEPGPGAMAQPPAEGAGGQLVDGLRRTGAALALAGRSAGRTLAGWWGRSADTLLSFVDEVGFAVSRLSP